MSAPQQQASTDVTQFSQGQGQFIQNSQVVDINKMKNASAHHQNNAPHTNQYGPYKVLLGQGADSNNQYLSGFSLNASQANGQAASDPYPQIKQEINSANSPFWKIKEDSPSVGPAGAHGHYWNMDYPHNSVDSVLILKQEAQQQNMDNSPEYHAAKARNIGQIGQNATYALNRYRSVSNDGHRYVTPENIGNNGSLLFAHPQLVHLNQNDIVYPPKPDAEGKTFDDYQLGASLLSLAAEQPHEKYVSQDSTGKRVYNHQQVAADTENLKKVYQDNGVTTNLPQVIQGLTRQDPTTRTPLETAYNQLEETKTLSKTADVNQQSAVQQPLAQQQQPVVQQQQSTIQPPIAQQQQPVVQQQQPVIQQQQQPVIQPTAESKNNMSQIQQVPDNTMASLVHENHSDSTPRKPVSSSFAAAYKPSSTQLKNAPNHPSTNTLTNTPPTTLKDGAPRWNEDYHDHLNNLDAPAPAPMPVPVPQPAPVPPTEGPVVLSIYDMPMQGYKSATAEELRRLEQEYDVVPANQWYPNTRYFPKNSFLEHMTKDQISRYHTSYIEVIRDGKVEHIPRDFSQMQVQQQANRV